MSGVILREYASLDEIVVGSLFANRECLNILGAFDKYRQMHPSFLNETKYEIPTTLTQYVLLSLPRTIKPPPI